MARNHRRWNYSVSLVIANIILLLINFSSGDDFGNSSNVIGTTPLKSQKDKAIGGKHELFSASLDGINSTVIPGWQESDDFENWTPPIEIQRDMPTYLAGFDTSGRPIWVGEMGRFNFGKYLRGGKKEQELFEKYLRYMAYFVLKSLSLKSTKERPVHQFVYIMDVEGFRAQDIADVRVFRWMVKSTKIYRQYAERYGAKFIFININSAIEIWLSTARPYLGRILGRLEVYGTNKYEWGPKLAKYVPPDQLPEWYGGTKEFKPIFVMG